MRYWTSDPHFGHLNVIRYCNRPYNTVDQMNLALVANWNSVVQPEDTVVCVGDFSLSLEAAEIFTPMLNGYKILYAGNHDHCHPSHRKSKGAERRDRMTKKYLEYGWNEVHVRGEVKLEGLAEKVTVSHLPYANPNIGEDDQRFMDFRPPDRGRWLICGHTHNSWTLRCKMVNVGVDRHNFTPISDTTLVGIIKSAKF